MNVWRKVMSFFGVRPVRPPITPLHSLAETEKAGEELQEAVQRHREISNWVVEKSLDAVDRTEEAHTALRTVIERASVPGAMTAEGAWELVRRVPDANHH